MPTSPPGFNFDTKIRKRSVMISGHATSVSLEQAFWQRLKAIARHRGVSVNVLIAEIDGERTPPEPVPAKAGASGRAGNLSSAIRVFVLGNTGGG